MPGFDSHIIEFIYNVSTSWSLTTTFCAQQQPALPRLSYNPHMLPLNLRLYQHKAKHKSKLAISLPRLTRCQEDIIASGVRLYRPKKCRGQGLLASPSMRPGGRHLRHPAVLSMIYPVGGGRNDHRGRTSPQSPDRRLPDQASSLIFQNLGLILLSVILIKIIFVYCWFLIVK